MSHQVRSGERKYLDRNKLPPSTTIQKASFCAPEYRFGTVYTVDRETYELHASREGCRSYLESEQPETYELVMRPNQIALPDGWRIERSWTSTNWHEAEYVSMSLVVVHSPFVKLEGNFEIVDRNLEFVSAALQRNCGFANGTFSWRRAKERFTPLIITPREYRFYLYRPTREVVDRGIATFQRVLQGLNGLSGYLPSLRSDLERHQRLSRIRRDVEDEGGDITPQINKIRVRLRDVLHPYVGRFGFVYKDLPGSQQVVPFSYDMNGHENPS